MYALGLDIGTTSLSGALIDTETGEQLASETVANDAAIPGKPWERMQDPDRLLELGEGIIEKLSAKADKAPGCIGLTGQMHGVLYYDRDGKAIAPLVTWEDGRGDLERGGVTPAKELSVLTGYPMATGYGLTTCRCDAIEGKIPDGAEGVCTIADYVAMRLCGLRRALMHPSNAASLGLFDLARGGFDLEAVEKASIPERLLPEVSRGETVAGCTPQGVPVAAAIGDNQAGIYAAAGISADTVINIGTSSQLSALAESAEAPDGLECRPYLEGKYIWLGSGLCGGSSMKLLNSFFCEVCACAGVETDSGEMFAVMEREAAGAWDKAGIPEVITLFRGTRSNPALRGSISGIGAQGLSVGALTLGFYRGVCGELKGFYDRLPENMRSGRLVVCGNAARRNATMLRTIKSVFGREAVLSRFVEEAAAGAALAATVTVQKG